MSKMDFTLRSPDGRRSLRGRVTLEASRELSLTFDGYGDNASLPGYGAPLGVALEDDGSLRIFVWGDINAEDPTEVIDLDGAREEARR